jgi:hypothetical protein
MLNLVVREITAGLSKVKQKRVKISVKKTTLLITVNEV